MYNKEEYSNIINLRNRKFKEEQYTYDMVF